MCVIIFSLFNIQYTKYVNVSLQHSNINSQYTKISVLYVSEELENVSGLQNRNLKDDAIVN